MRRLLVSVLALSLVACGPESTETGDLPEGNTPTSPTVPAGSAEQEVETPAATLEKNIHCSYIGDAGFFFHDVYVFRDGAVLTTCEVDSNAFTISNTRMYRPSQQGTSTGYCSLVHDYDAPSSGWWAFEHDHAAKTSLATYNDSGSTMNGGTVQLECKTF